MSLVAINDFCLIMTFHQMISIRDRLCKLGYIKCELKLIKVILIILSNFACIVFEFACKIFNFSFVILEQNVQFFGHSLKNYAIIIK